MGHDSNSTESRSGQLASKLSRWYGKGALWGTYGWLLCALMLAYISGPLVAHLNYGVRVADGIAILVVFAAILAVTNHRVHVWSLAIIALFAAVPQALDTHIESNWTGILANLSSAAFLVYLLVVVMRDIFATTKVSVDTLVGSICGYLLLAATFAAAYSTLNLLVPDAFIVDERLDIDPASLHYQGVHFSVLLYFSVITLSTVGYGDIIPGTDVARQLVTAEAIMGQVYLTVIVARLVGMHLTSSLKR